MKTLRYKATGHGKFPLDMLRYDMAWPSTSRDVDKLDETEARDIEISSYAMPTQERWLSFGWTIQMIRK